MLKSHLCYPQTVSPQKPISLSPATSPVKWGMLTASALQDCSEDKGDGTGAMLGSELATSAQGRAVATASQNPVQVCRGTGWLPTRGVEHRREQHRQHRTFGGPQQTLDVGSLPEQVLRLQRPSLRVEAEALGRRQKGGPESAPTLS